MRRKFRDYLRPAVERVPALLLLYRALREARRELERPTDTPLGFKFCGNTAMAQGTFEPEERELVSELLRGADRLVNIGANVGYYCCLALQNGVKVMAFEPIVENLSFLYKNITANGWEGNAEIFPLALSDSVGIRPIYGGGVGASLVTGWAGTSERYVRPVPTSTFDTLLGTRLRGDRVLVIMDVEGAENAVLNGASLLLRNEPRRAWMVEISIGEHQPKGTHTNPSLLPTFKVFGDNGYDAFTANRERRKVTYEEVEAITKSGIHTLGTHNFLFVEKGAGFSVGLGGEH